MAIGNNALDVIVELLKNGEIKDLFEEAGENYVKVGRNIVDTIQLLVEEAGNVKSLEEQARFVQSVRHTVNSVFLMANAAATKIERMTGNVQDAQERVTKIASEVITELAVASFEEHFK